jgi:hypothetical protein
MTKEEALRHIEAAKLMLLGKDNQPVSDLYYALDIAIEALERDDPEVEFQKRFERSTFCGYTSKELLMFADACRRQGITEEYLFAFCKNAEDAFAYAFEKIAERFKKEVERKLS